MHPRIGKRSKYNTTEKKKETKAVEFIVRNTKKSITLKQEYLYLEDVKTALNIHHLEENIRIRKALLDQLKAGCSSGTLIGQLENAVDHDRHRLQKLYKISI
jgi:hypothetical protein